MPALVLAIVCMLLAGCAESHASAAPRHGLLVIVALDATTGRPLTGASVQAVPERVDLRLPDGLACDAHGECELPFEVVDTTPPRGRVAWVTVTADGYVPERHEVDAIDIERPVSEPRTLFFMLPHR